MLPGGARLDVLIDVLVQVTDKYMDRQGTRELNLPDQPKPTALKCFESFHHNDDENLDSYDITKISEEMFEIKHKITMRSYFVEIMPDCQMACDVTSCNVSCSHCSK